MAAHVHSDRIGQTWDGIGWDERQGAVKRDGRDARR
ncbi:hypothetical protein E2C01_096605 [Portunus trituberculatus]|uniref:Uncharacterized protein n=1 Tax=Portunus trituberculatus TaxID=210409 RepID=A0A5B7JYC9_PORTR|nr:hypothetical protein [Portunus trituberculatus]